MLNIQLNIFHSNCADNFLSAMWAADLPYFPSIGIEGKLTFFTTILIKLQIIDNLAFKVFYTWRRKLFLKSIENKIQNIFCMKIHQNNFNIEVFIHSYIPSCIRRNCPYFDIFSP